MGKKTAFRKRDTCDLFQGGVNLLVKKVCGVYMLLNDRYGLYRDYGPAQQLYFQLGYIPEGNGITYKGQPTVAGQAYLLDDDLLLWMVKPLINAKKAQ